MPAAAKRAHVGFVITGEYMTGLVHDRVIEGRWDHAFKILKDGLHGIDDTTVLSILRGEARLEGENTLDLVKEDQPAYRERLAYAFAGCIRAPSGRVLRPYAVVTSWGAEDMATVGDDAPVHRDAKLADEHDPRAPTRSVRLKDFQHRTLFYADDPRQDVVFFLKLTAEERDEHDAWGRYAEVLFRAVQNFPTLLVDTHAFEDAQGALDAYRAAGHHLETRGYEQAFGGARYRFQTAKDEEPAVARSFDVVADDKDFIDAGAIVRAEVLRGDAAQALRTTDAVIADCAASPRSDLKDFAERASQKIVDLTDEMARASEVVADPDAPMDKRMAAMTRQNQLREKAGERLDAYKAEVLAQNAAAGDRFLDLAVEAEGGAAAYTLRVPYAPFAAWALRGTPGGDLVAWKPIAPPSYKMLNDDRAHTDWMLGAGLDPKVWRFGGGDALSTAAWELRGQVQREVLGFKVQVLCGSGKAYGEIKRLKRGEALTSPRQIGLIPNAGPDFVQAAKSAVDLKSCLITAAGGSVAHLVTAFRDQPLRMVREADALTRYPEGMSVMVDLDTGRIEVSAHQFGTLRVGGGEPA